MNALAEPLPLHASIERNAITGAVHIPLSLLQPSPSNPRKNFDQAQLQELADSITSHGLLQPILVRPIDSARAGQPLYEIVAGERRWRASQLAGQPSIMALVKPMSDFEVLEVQLIENLRRSDLTELEEASGYHALLRAPTGLQGYATVDELAARVGKSRSYVFQRLKLLDLTEPGRQALASGQIGFSVALLIARLRTPAAQAEATRTIVAGWGGQPMTYKDAEEYIHNTYHLALDRAPFAITDADLVPAAGSCRDCPKRTGANPDLFADVAKADTCTDGACYHAKEDAHRAALKAQAAAQGMQVITGADAKKIKPQQYGRALGYLELDKVHPSLHDTKPLRKLLAKADVKPVLVEDPHTKALVEMVSEKEALSALQAAGVVQTAKLPSTSANERAAADKTQRELAWRNALAEQVLDAARTAGDAFRVSMIARVAVLLWHELHNDSRQRITKLLGWPPLKSRWSDGPGTTADQHIQALSDGDLCRYLTAATIVADTHIGSYQTITAPQALLATATELGIDADAVKASVREQQRVTRKTTPDKTAAARKMAKAGQLTPETALAQAIGKAQAKATADAKPRQPLKAPVKYRCPATGSTWSGRGLRPRWITAALEGGATLASLLVPGSNATTTAPVGHPASFISDAAADPFRGA